jgi:colicin import membrane protein
MQKCTLQSTEAHDERTRSGGDWFALKLKARLLVVAALAVGFALANPSYALAPKLMPSMLVQRTPMAAKHYAQLQLNNYGWASQWGCLQTLWQNESNWRPDAKNHTPVPMLINGRWIKFYAGGIPQRLGLNPKATVEKQIQVGLDYIKNRYVTPCKALQWWKKHYWY